MTHPAQHVIIIGPAHPLRGGGLTTFNHRMARAFTEAGDRCEIFSFSLQYPSFLFPGTSQFTTEPGPEGLVIHSVINSISPINWWRVGRQMSKIRPDLIVVRFWIPFMGACLGTILRLVRRNQHTRIICLADNVCPHEKRIGDRMLTSWFLKSCDAFVTMSEKVMWDLRSFERSKPAALVPHPIYDNFGTPVPRHEAREKLGIGHDEKVVLFFGFIRHYKGLDMLLTAMADDRIRRAGIRLLVAGEFYEDAKMYQEQIDQLNIRSSLILRTSFIPDAEVPLYFSAADVVIQPYREATQSGVTPLAYHFDKPMIVTRVGGLPDLVPHERAGLVVDPEPHALADGVLRFFELGDAFFIPHLRDEKKKLSWSRLIGEIKDLGHGIMM